MKLDNSVVVQWEYASEERLATRNEIYHLPRLDRGVAELARVLGTIVFPDADSIRTFVGASITRAHLAAAVPGIAEPFRTSSADAVFVAEKAA